MSHKHDKILREVFAATPSANIHWHEVESLLNHLGAEVASHGSRFHVVLNGHEGSLHRPHHGSTLTKHEVRHLRDLLHAAGVDV